MVICLGFCYDLLNYIAVVNPAKAPTLVTEHLQESSNLEFPSNFKGEWMS